MLLTAARLPWCGNAKACFKSRTAVILELWQKYWFIKWLLFHMRKGHQSCYEPFLELEMPTLGFYMLLFYDSYYTEEFQCLVSLSALQAQRFRIGANFVRQAMSLISPVETWGRNVQAFLNTSPSSYFYTRSEMVFDSPKLCAFCQSHCLPLLLGHFSVDPSPLTSFSLPQAKSSWSKACVRQKF